MKHFHTVSYATGEDRAEAMGYDAGRNKPNEVNCHFGIFATTELTRAWERGKKRGDAEREAAESSQGDEGTVKGIEP